MYSVVTPPPPPPIYNCLSGGTEVKSWKHPRVNSCGVSSCNVQLLLLEFGSNYPSHSNHKRSQLQQASTPMFDDCTGANCVVARCLLTHEDKYSNACVASQSAFIKSGSQSENLDHKTRTIFCVFTTATLLIRVE